MEPNVGFNVRARVVRCCAPEGSYRGAMETFKEVGTVGALVTVVCHLKGLWNSAPFSSILGHEIILYDRLPHTAEALRSRMKLIKTDIS